MAQKTLSGSAHDLDRKGLQELHSSRVLLSNSTKTTECTASESDQINGGTASTGRDGHVDECSHSDTEEAETGDETSCCCLPAESLNLPAPCSEAMVEADLEEARSLGFELFDGEEKYIEFTKSETEVEVIKKISEESANEQQSRRPLLPQLPNKPRKQSGLTALDIVREPNVADKFSYTTFDVVVHDNTEEGGNISWNIFCNEKLEHTQQSTGQGENVNSSPPSRTGHEIVEGDSDFNDRVIQVKPAGLRDDIESLTAKKPTIVPRPPTIKKHDCSNFAEREKRFKVPTVTPLLQSKVTADDRVTKSLEKSRERAERELNAHKMVSKQVKRHKARMEKAKLMCAKMKPVFL